MELEITWSRAVRVWWSFVWRNLIAVVAGIVLGAIFGFIITFVMRSMGFSPSAIQFVVVLLSGGMGLALSVIPLKMILGKDFGAFRLVLLAKQPPDRSAPLP